MVLFALLASEFTSGPSEREKITLDANGSFISAMIESLRYAVGGAPQGQGAEVHETLAMHKFVMAGLFFILSSFGPLKEHVTEGRGTEREKDNERRGELRDCTNFITLHVRGLNMAFFIRCLGADKAFKEWKRQGR